MKTLIIYKSIHHQNTEKIAQIIAKILNADLSKPEKTKEKDLKDYDLIGFGSGIYAWKHHQSILNLVNNLNNKKKNNKKNKKAFIFSTSGSGNTKINHQVLRKKLKEKGFKIKAEFNCKGWDTFGPLKLIGGINKQRPNKKDLDKARQFAEKLRN
jgi:flavodoxin